MNLTPDPEALAIVRAVNLRHIKHGDGKTCPESPERIARAKADPPARPTSFTVIKLDGTILRYGE